MLPAPGRPGRIWPLRMSEGGYFMCLINDLAELLGCLQKSRVRWLTVHEYRL